MNNERWHTYYVYPYGLDSVSSLFDSVIDNTVQIFHSPIISLQRDAALPHFFIRYRDELGFHTRHRVYTDASTDVQALVILALEQYGWIPRRTQRGWEINDAYLLTTGEYVPEFQRYGGFEHALDHDQVNTHSSMFAYEVISRIIQLGQVDSYVIKSAIVAHILTSMFSGSGIFSRTYLNALYDASETEFSHLPLNPQLFSHTLQPFVKPAIQIVQSCTTFPTFLSSLRGTTNVIGQSCDPSSFLASHLHMLCNRLGISRQTEHQLYQYSRQVNN